MYGQIELQDKDLVLSSGSSVLCIFKCLNCSAMFKKPYKNRNQMHRCSSFKEEFGKKLKWCFKCSTWLELNFFQKATHVYGGFSKTCRDCREIYMNKAEKVRKKKHRTFYEMTGELTNRKLHSILNLAKGRANKQNLAFDLDIAYLRDIWKKQEGKCFYSGLEMIWNKEKVGFSSPSLDKLNPRDGYTKGNVVFCLFAVNSFKQELTSTAFLTLVKGIRWK